MRKGYILVEMIVVLAVFAMITIGLDRFFVTLNYDLPRDSRLIQENRSLANAVNHIQADVALAKTLSQLGDDSNEPNTLLIELPGGVVSYKFSDGRILRSFAGSTDGNMVWPVPHGGIEWQVWNKGNTGYAVEIKTCIEDRSFGQTQKKMANSNLFFAGALWEAAE
jgi:hypothetical protein